MTEAQLRAAVISLLAEGVLRSTQVEQLRGARFKPDADIACLDSVRSYHFRRRFDRRYKRQLKFV